jgi:hypothetical protein
VKFRLPLLFIFLLLSCFVFAQKKSATITGRVIDENEMPLANVSVVILGQQKGISTSDSGRFSIKVPADKAIALVFSSTGYKTTQQNFILNEGEQEQITIRLETGSGMLEGVVITDQRDRT